MWFKLVLIKRFPILSLVFKHVTNNSQSEPRFYLKVEDKISLLSTLSATMLSLLILLSSSEIYSFWKSWESFPVFLLFLFFMNFLKFFSIKAFRSFLLFVDTLKFFFLFYLCLLTRPFKSLYLSVVWLHFPWRMQYLFICLWSIGDFLLESPTLEL